MSYLEWVLRQGLLLYRAREASLSEERQTEAGDDQTEETERADALPAGTAALPFVLSMEEPTLPLRRAAEKSAGGYSAAALTAPFLPAGETEAFLPSEAALLQEAEACREEGTLCGQTAWPAAATAFGTEQPDAQALSRLWERDARRYDARWTEETI